MMGSHRRYKRVVKGELAISWRPTYFSSRLLNLPCQLLPQTNQAAGQRNPRALGEDVTDRDQPWGTEQKWREAGMRVQQPVGDNQHYGRHSGTQRADALGSMQDALAALIQLNQMKKLVLSKRCCVLRATDPGPLGFHFQLIWASKSSDFTGLLGLGVTHVQREWSCWMPVKGFRL